MLSSMLNTWAPYLPESLPGCPAAGVTAPIFLMRKLSLREEAH